MFWMYTAPKAICTWWIPSEMRSGKQICAIEHVSGFVAYFLFIWKGAYVMTEEERNIQKEKLKQKLREKELMKSKVNVDEDVPVSEVLDYGVEDSMTEKQCQCCGRMVKADSIVCSYCGTPFADMVHGNIVPYREVTRNEQFHSRVPNMPSTQNITIVNQIPTGDEKKTSGFAIASLVCSLVGILFFKSILGMLGFIFGCIGLSQCDKTHKPYPYSGIGMAIAGVVIGGLDFCFSFLGLIVLGLIFG